MFVQVDKKSKPYSSSLVSEKETNEYSTQENSSETEDYQNVNSEVKENNQNNNVQSGDNNDSQQQFSTVPTNTNGTFNSVDEAVAWGRQQVQNGKASNFKVINVNNHYQVILR